MLGFGAFLRLCQISGQILVGDEWHGARVAIYKNLPYIFTHFGKADNCIPLTLYYKLLLNTIGLSELGFHSLPLLFGLASLILFPLVIRRLFEERTLFLFSSLVAISPFLIYYSRYARPYMIVALLSFVAVFSFYRWLVEGRTVHAVLYGILAITAPYFNLMAFAPVIAPLCYALIFKKQPVRKLFLMGMIIAMAIAAWLIPAIDSFDHVMEKIGDPSLSLDTATGVISLFSGTRHAALIVVFVLLFLLGLWSTYKQDLYLWGYLLFIFSAQILLIVITNPQYSHLPYVFARYAVSLLPLFLLMVSIGLNEGAKRFKIFRWALGPFLILVFCLGPLPGLYHRVNNLTNHGDFQSSYDEKELDHEIPRFYVQLRDEENEASIIEIPLLVQCSMIPYHLYQKVHKKRIMTGHGSDSYAFSAGSKMSMDVQLFPKDKVRFRNLINVDDPNAVKQCGAKYIVVHRNVLRETRQADKGPVGERLRLYADTMIRKLSRRYGEPAQKSGAASMAPFYEDDWIVVFRIR